MSSGWRSAVCAALMMVPMVSFGEIKLKLNEVPSAVEIAGKNGGEVGTGKPWLSSTISGKVYTLVYVDPDEKDANVQWEKAMKAKNFDRTIYGSMTVVNMAASWKPNSFIEMALEAKQKEYPHTKFVKDMNRLLVNSWGLKDEDFNVLLFSKEGKLLFAKAGTLSQNEIEQYIALVDEYLKKIAKPSHMKIILTLATVASLSGCSFRSVKTAMIADTLYDATSAVEYEDDLELFLAAMPSSLVLLEGLVAQSPENEYLLAALTKGYAVYAYGQFDTEGLPERFLDWDATPLTDKASRIYRRGLSYGFRYLEVRGLSLGEMKASAKAGTLDSALSQYLQPQSARDMDTLLFTLQAWSSLINLNRSDVRLVGDVYLVSGMLEWFVAQRSGYRFGLPETMLAGVRASRPRALGGHPEKARESFLELMRRYPDNRSIAMVYLETYLVPRMATKEANKVMAEMQKGKANSAGDSPKPRPSYPENEYIIHEQNEMALSNAIAMRRLHWLQKHAADIF